MSRRLVFALLLAPVLTGAGAREGLYEEPYEETCSPVPEPPAVTRFALLTDTLVIEDTSDFPLDTLWVELEPLLSVFHMSLLAGTPAGDYPANHVASLKTIIDPTTAESGTAS